MRLTSTTSPTARETKVQTPQMSTAEFTRDIDADWSAEDRFLVEQDDPLPFTLRGSSIQTERQPRLGMLEETILL